MEVENSSQSSSKQAGMQQQQKSIKFRNYVPNDPSLMKHRISNKIKGTRDIVEEIEMTMLYESIASKSTADGSSSRVDDEVDLSNEDRSRLASSGNDKKELVKKIDWDLKRDIESKLNKLARRTQRAIYELAKVQQQQEERQQQPQQAASE